MKTAGVVRREYPDLPLSFLVSKTGSTYYAKSGSTRVVKSSTDAASLIQDCLDDLPARGGKIFFKSGVYLIGQTLLPTKTTIFEGEGVGWEARTLGASIKLSAAVNDDMIRFDNDSPIPFCAFKYIQLDGNRAHQTVPCHQIEIVEGIRDLHLQRCFLNEGYGDGLRAINPDDTHISLGTLFITDSLIESFTGVGINLQATTDEIEATFIQNCYFYENYNHLKLNGTLFQDIKLMNSVLKKSDRHGIHLTSTRSRVIVQGNIIMDASFEAPNTYDGVYVDDDTVTGAQDIHVDNNIITSLTPGQQRWGVNVNSTLADYIDVLGNNVRGNATGGVTVLAGANLNGQRSHNQGDV